MTEKDPVEIALSMCNQWRDETQRLYQAIRKHRDQKGDDRCWMDDEELYKALPEGYRPQVKDTAVELKNCQRFLACRQNPATSYVSPQRRIEELEAKLAVIHRHATSIRIQTVVGIIDCPNNEALHCTSSCPACDSGVRDDA